MTDFSTMKLGALFHEDKRNIKLMAILKTLPPYPPAFDVDSQYPALTDANMFKNDIYGDCVIAGRAHQTLRFEDFEQKSVIPISDVDVTNEYFKESGGADSGLDITNSLNAWRQGWTAAGQNYSIYAYAQVNVQSQNEVMAAMYLLNGLYIGLLLPVSAQTQDVWDVVPGGAWNTLPGSWGGHCVYLVAYDADGLTCMTWGKRQKMTWPFFRMCCNQAFAIVDNKDSWVVNDNLDMEALYTILAEITGEPVPAPTPVPTPTPPVPTPPVPVPPPDPPTPTTGTIVVSSIPPAVIISVDNIIKGAAPQTITLPAGDHVISGNLPGYTFGSYTIPIAAGSNYTFTITLSKPVHKCCISQKLAARRKIKSGAK